MSKNVSPGAFMALGAVGAGLLWYLGKTRKHDCKKAFDELVRQAGITDPEQVWNLCTEYHKRLQEEHLKTKSELVEAQARIAAGEEICRVGQGLADVQKMMRGEDWPQAIKSKQFWGLPISKEEMDEARENIKKKDVPTEVKAAIIAHWWTQLWQLFVPWGILTPKEIEDIEEPFFRLVGPGNREAALRSEVFRYKSQFESYKEFFEKTLEGQEEDSQYYVNRQIQLRKEFDEEREVWRKEKEKMQQKIDVLDATITRLESGKLHDDIG